MIMQIKRKDEQNSISYFHTLNINGANRQPSPSRGMNIYIGNLSQEVTEEDLRETFSAYGRITNVKVVKDRESGEPKGFGFVEMPAMAEARSAIKNLNGTMLKGQIVKVSEARPRVHPNRSNGNSNNGPFYY